jgi:predicted phosphodiesterase
MAFSKDRAKEIFDFVEQHGINQAVASFGISSESIHRALRQYDVYLKQFLKEDAYQHNKLLTEIGKMYTPQELQAISKGGRIIAGMEPVPIISFEGQHIRIGYMGDTHMGHKHFSESRFMQALDEFRKAKVDFWCHTGDVCEGMSHRAGHIYELDHLGYDSQKEYAIHLFSQWTDTPIYAIDGNHDRWFIMSNGAMIVKDIDKALSNFHFLGHDEGDISLKGIAVLKLWHGLDGNSYALSYRVQKIIESLSGGEKPDLMFCGHTHKYLKLFIRNVHAVSTASIVSQTAWMRGKRIEAHVGFGFVDVWVNEKGICKISDTFFPFYT